MEPIQHRNLQQPNFRDDEGNLYIVRCYACDGDYGRENYAMSVAKGYCAWCGWSEKSWEKRVLEIEKAYEEMQKRGWGFSSNGDGFGDPEATMTAVGPYDGVHVVVLGMDKDCVKAVEKAIAKAEESCV